MERLRRGDRIDQHDTVRVTKDGRRIDVSVSVSPITNERGEVLGAATIARDNTERRRDEVRLRFLAEVGEVLAESLDYQTTLQAVARLAVPTLADWCAIDMVQEDGTVARLAVAHQDPAKVVLAHELHERYPPDPDATTGLPHVLRTGESELYPEIPDEMLVAGCRDEEHLRIARELGLTSALVVPLTARGRILGAVSWVYAESNRRYDESDVAFAQELARRAALAVDNARLYRQTQAAIRDRDDVLTMVSHDLRSPLTSIMGMAQLLQRSVDADEQPRVARGLERIEATTRRMDGLIDELVDVARLRVGAEIQLRRSAVNLAALVRQAIDEHEQRTGQHRITLEGPSDGLVGMWDGPRLRRVLDNLLSNATKYSPEGGLIEVELHREDGAEGPHAVLKVRDYGVGIPPEDQERIFEPGQRGRNVGDIGGTGIGLAGACQTVQQHGGTIEVESELGKGSTFTVRLPLIHSGERDASIEGRAASPPP
jgi:signal transduction histidine kinase